MNVLDNARSETFTDEFIKKTVVMGLEFSLLVQQQKTR